MTEEEFDIQRALGVLKIQTLDIDVDYHTVSWDVSAYTTGATISVKFRVLNEIFEFTDGVRVWIDNFAYTDYSFGDGFSVRVSQENMCKIVPNDRLWDYIKEVLVRKDRFDD